MKNYTLPRPSGAMRSHRMNQSQSPSRVSFRLVPDPNPWADPLTLPRLSHIGTLLLCLFVLACAVYPTTPMSALHTGVMLLCCAVVYIAVVRSVLPCLAAVLVALLGTLIGSITGGAVVLCLLSAVSVGAFLICTVRSRWLLTVPALAYAIALALSGDALASLVALIAFPAAGILAYAIMQNSGRVGTICATSAVFGLCALFALALAWYRTSGTLTPDELRTLFSKLREQLIVTMQESEFVASLQQWLDEMQITYTDASTLIRTTVELGFALLPASLVTLCNLFGYAAQLACTHAFVGVGMNKLRTRVSQLFVLSVPSALVFFVCAVAALFTNTLALGGAVVANLFWILLPGMCVVGVYKLIADVRSRRSPLMLLLVAASLLFAPAFLIFGLALSGAMTTLLRPLFTRMMLLSHMQDKNDPSDKDE